MRSLSVTCSDSLSIKASFDEFEFEEKLKDDLSNLNDDLSSFALADLRTFEPLGEWTSQYKLRMGGNSILDLKIEFKL